MKSGGGDYIKESYNAHFDYSGEKEHSQKYNDASKDEIDEIANTNNFYLYEDVCKDYDPSTSPYSYFYLDIHG